MKFNVAFRVPGLFRGEPIVRSLALCWVITKLLCYQLWMADRFFPLVPVNDSLLQVPAYFHTIVFGLSLFCMAVLVVFPRKQLAIVLLFLEVIACLFDQNRWQTWEWFFVFLLAAYVFIRDKRARIFSWQLIIIGLYLFSGLSKCNSSFINNVWKELFLKQFAGAGQTSTWVLRMGYLLPILEIASAVFLCFNRSVKMGVLILIAMHLVNLVVFGPLGISTNSTIWPWNIFMPILLVLLFYKGGISFSERNLWKPLFTTLVLLCWWVLPGLQLAGLWNNKYLPCNLYSGKTNYMYICSDDLHARLRLTDCFTYTKFMLPCADALSVYQWSMREMNSPPFPEERVYKALAREWNKWYPGGNNRFFLVSGGVKREVREIKDLTGF